MTNHLATKTDIMELKAEISELRSALREQGLRLTIQLGLMVSGIMGIGLAAARLMFTS